MVKRVLAAYALVLFAVKLFAASRLGLFRDEIFYYLCGQRLDIHFADLPFMTAFLVRLGTALAGNTPLAVRLIFLLIGVSFPLVIYRLARPLVGDPEAWLAAGLALTLPLFGMLGVLAVPDVPMLVLSALFLLGFERATRENTTGPWLLTGLFAAAGLATHYRFILAPFSAFLYLVITRNGRLQWKRGGLYLAVLAMLPGFLPTVLYNLRSGFAPINYFVGERHGLIIRPSGLLDFLSNQVVMVTPLLFAALILTLAALVRKAREGDDRASLMLIFSVLPLGLYTMASLFYDTSLITLHWPAPGYIPLLVFLPGTISGLVRRRPTWLRRTAAVLTPGLGAAILLLVLVELGSGFLGLGGLRKHAFGWSQAADEVKHEYMEPLGMLSEKDSTGRPVVVADNYILGANLEFKLQDRADIYILDHKRNRQDGRSGQFDQWGIGEPDLRGRAGEDALVIVEVTGIRPPHREAWMAHVGSFFQRLEPLGELQLKIPGKDSLTPEWARKVTFRFYRGQGIRAARSGDE